MRILVEDELAFQKLPEAKATFYFTDGKSVIFAGLSSDLYARINSLLAQKAEDDKIRELWDRAEDLVYDIRLTDMDSLVWYKSLIKSFTPYFNDYINIWNNYTYLAIDLNNAPYLSVKENTQSDLSYLGPFRSRFFITDVIAVFNRYLKLPMCGDNPAHCEIINSEYCISTCTNQDLNKLKVMIQNYYLSPVNDLADILINKYQEYYNNLEFLKAEGVKVETKIILKYYKFLNFLSKTKDLHKTFIVDNRVYSVEDGLLAEVSGKDSLDFRDMNRKIPYRDNELLAVNKNQVDERWIVFNFMEDNLKTV